MNLKEFLVGILSTTKSRRSRNLGGSTDNKLFENILFIIWIRIARDSIAAKRTSSLLLRYTNRKRPVPTPRVRKKKTFGSTIPSANNKIGSDTESERSETFTATSIPDLQQGLEYSHERISRVENSLTRWALSRYMNNRNGNVL